MASSSASILKNLFPHAREDWDETLRAATKEIDRLGNLYNLMLSTHGEQKIDVTVKDLLNKLKTLDRRIKNGKSVGE